MMTDDERQFADVIAELREDEGHEPSPLFWEHFSARVAGAIHQEPEVPASRWAWLRNPATGWAAGAAIVMLLLVAVAWRATLVPRAPAPSAATAALSAPTGDIPITGVADDVEADEAWALVRAAADEWHWEDAREAGIAARLGAAEDVALELTAAERSELARLLEVEMNTGAS